MQQRSNTPRRMVRLAQQLNRACILAVACALVGPAVVRAQTCVGLPGPEGGRVQLGAGFSSMTPASQFTVYAGGVGSSLFGQAYSATTNYDGWRGFASTSGAGLGLRMLKGAGGAFELCPVVAGGIGGILSEANGRRERIASTRDARVGVSIGYRVDVNKSFAVIPSVRADFENASLDQSNIDFNSSLNYGLLRMSAGLVMGTRFTAYPSVSVPFGIDGGRHAWGLAFTLSLWQKRP